MYLSSRCGAGYDLQSGRLYTIPAHLARGLNKKEVWGVQRLYLDGCKERERKWEIAER